MYISSYIIHSSQIDHSIIMIMHNKNQHGSNRIRKARRRKHMPLRQTTRKARTPKTQSSNTTIKPRCDPYPTDDEHSHTLQAG